MKVEYHLAIEDDLRGIVEYYDGCSKGLGTALLDEFEQQILRIAAMPTRWMVVEGGIRRSLMR